MLSKWNTVTKYMACYNYGLTGRIRSAWVPKVLISALNAIREDEVVNKKEMETERRNCVYHNKLVSRYMAFFAINLFIFRSKSIPSPLLNWTHPPLIKLYAVATLNKFWNKAARFSNISSCNPDRTITKFIASNFDNRQISVVPDKIFRRLE